MSMDFSELHQLSVDLGDSAARVGARVATALRKAAHDIERDGKQLAAVDTGFMRGSISASIDADGRSASMSAEIGPTAEYAQFVEEGTSTQRPQPFMGPAFDRTAPLFERAVGIAGEESIL